MQAAQNPQACIQEVEVYCYEKNLWKQVPIKQPSNFVPFYMSLAVQISEHEIMIFGGKLASQKKLQAIDVHTKSCYIFNTEESTFKDGPPLKNPSSFTTQTVSHSNCLYVIGTDDHLH